MKEDHLVKMASLRQEAELLKQQAEVEKMRKELKELRGEKLPLEENKKVNVFGSQADGNKVDFVNNSSYDHHDENPFKLSFKLCINLLIPVSRAAADTFKGYDLLFFCSKHLYAGTR